MYHSIEILKRGDNLLIFGSHSQTYITHSPIPLTNDYRDLVLTRNEHTISVRVNGLMSLEDVKIICGKYLEEFPHCYNRRATNGKKHAIRK